MHPALLILLTCLLTQVIAWLGKDNISNLAYSAFSSIFNRGPVARQKALRKEIFQVKQELGMTSSQDEFAKWAKLRRRVDKGLAELEVVNGQIASSRSKFNLVFKSFLFILSTGVPFIATTYHRKTAIFYLPPGDWLGPLSWLFALPSAPAGAVSATIWSTACKRVLALVEARVKDVFVKAPATEGSSAAQDAAKGVPLQYAEKKEGDGSDGTSGSSATTKPASEESATARRRTTAAATS